MSQSYHTFGIQALERMAEAPAFNKWMYATIRPYIKGNTLEIGSGIGNISHFFVEANQKITLSDIDEKELAVLRERFAHCPNVQDILRIDLADPHFTKKYFHLAHTFHSVFLLNVLEHIKEDSLAVRHCRFLLKEGGTLVILVPAYKKLFSKMDALLGHYRRYTTRSLGKVISSQNFAIEKAFYFNVLGMAGWWWNKLFHKAAISSGKMAIFNCLMPIAKMMDRIAFRKIGLSVIVVATTN